MIDLGALDDVLDQVADLERRLTALADTTRLSVGTVTAVNAGTLDLTVDGVAVEGAQYASSYYPEAGHVVVVAQNGPDPFVLTPAGPPTSPTTPGALAAPTLRPIPRGLEVTWAASAAADVINGRGYYDLQVHTDALFPALGRIDRQTITPGAVVGQLAAGTTYYARVRAVDYAGNTGAWSPASAGAQPSTIAAADLSVTIGGANLLSTSRTGLPNATGQSGALTADAAFTRYGADSAKFVSTAGAAGGGLLIERNNAAAAAVTVGRTYTFSAWVYSATARTLEVSSRWGTAAGALLGAWDSVKASTAVPAGTWTRLTATGVAPATAATSGILVDQPAAGAAGDTFWVAGLQIEEGDVATAYAPRPDEILPGTVGTTELAALAVTAAKIAANTITAAQIAANTITAAQIAATTITAAQIAANTITAAQVAADTLTAGQIAAGAITTSELAANAVTANELATINLAVGKAIRSTTFVSGSAGFQLDAAGVLEATNAIISGDITASYLLTKRGPNLDANGSFQSGAITGWTSLALSGTCAIAYTNAAGETDTAPGALKVTCNTNGDVGALGPALVVRAGRRVGVTAKAKATSGSMAMQVRLYWYTDTAGTVAATTPFTELADSGLGTWDWAAAFAYFVATAEVPTGAIRARLAPHAVCTATEAYVVDTIDVAELGYVKDAVLSTGSVGQRTYVGPSRLELYGPDWTNPAVIATERLNADRRLMLYQDATDTAGPRLYLGKAGTNGTGALYGGNNAGDNAYVIGYSVGLNPGAGGLHVMDPSSGADAITLSTTQLKLRWAAADRLIITAAQTDHVGVLVRSTLGAYIYNQDNTAGDTFGARANGTTGTIGIANPATIAVTHGKTFATWSRHFGHIFPGTSWAFIQKTMWRRASSTTADVNIDNQASQTYAWELYSIGA